MPLIKISKCENCGIAHEWIFDAPKLKELRDIKKLTGMSGNAFMEASDQGDPDALAALIYVLHKRDKITVNFDDVDLDFSTLDIEPTEDEKKAAEKEARNNQAVSDIAEGKVPSTRSGRTGKADSTGR